MKPFIRDTIEWTVFAIIIIFFVWLVLSGKVGQKIKPPPTGKKVIGTTMIGGRKAVIIETIKVQRHYRLVK